MCSHSERPKLLGFKRHPASASVTASQEQRLHLKQVALRPVRPLDAPEWVGRVEDNPTAEVSELAAADVWALGMLLATALVGGPPFKKADPNSCQLYSKFLRAGLSACPSLMASVPSPLHSLLSSTLRCNPNERPTALQLVTKLMPGVSRMLRQVPHEDALRRADSSQNGQNVEQSASSSSFPEVEHAATAPSTLASGVVSCGFPALGAHPRSDPSDSMSSAYMLHKEHLVRAKPRPPEQNASVESCCTCSSCCSAHTNPPAAPQFDRTLSRPTRADKSDPPELDADLNNEVNALKVIEPLYRSDSTVKLDSNPMSSVSSSSSRGTHPTSRRGYEACCSSSLSASPSPRPGLDQGYVRCLGWENLPLPAEVLIDALSNVLGRMRVPFIRPDPSPFHFQIHLPPPCQPTSTDFGTPDTQCTSSDFETEAQPLRVALHIFSVPDSPLHHIDVRRQQGAQSHFQDFYSRFRTELSAVLGLTSGSLSDYSPVIKRLAISRQAQRPAHGFTSREHSSNTMGNADSSRMSIRRRTTESSIKTLPRPASSEPHDC